MKIFYSNDDTFEANFNELLKRGKALSEANQSLAQLTAVVGKEEIYE